MTQYNSLHVNLSNSRLNNLKSAIEKENKIILRPSSNMIDNSGDETNFSHKLLLTYRQVANLRKTFVNDLSANIKLSKNQVDFLLKTGLPLMKNVLQPLAKSVLIPLGLVAAASTGDAGIHEKI